MFLTWNNNDQSHLKTMIDDQTEVDSGAETTVENIDAPVPLEDVKSSTEAPDIEGSASGQVKPPEADPLKVLESLTVDPATKEALKAGYLRQADYTRKTQALAEERKSVESLKNAMPILEFLNKNPELFNEVVSKMQGADQPQGQESIPDDPKEYAEWVKANTIKEVMAIQAREADFREAAKVDPRLDADSEFGEFIARTVASDPQYRSGEMTATEATKKAVEAFDKYISKAIYSAKQDLSKKAIAKKSGSTVRSTPGRVRDTSQAVSFEDAARQAEEELTS